MNYCINCGNKIEIKEKICPYCFWDPKVPKEKIDKFLHAPLKTMRYKKLNVEYPGERTSLAFAIFITIIICLIFSVITIGAFILYLFLAVTYLKIKQLQMKSNYIRASDRNYSPVYNLSKVAAYRMGIPLYPVYIVQSQELNAYTSGFWGEHWVVLHSRLVKLFSPSELLFVLGHEMGHILREHTTWLTLTSPYRSYSLPLINVVLRIVFNTWSLKSEYSADRMGLIACQDLDASISALVKLIADKDKIDIDAFLKEFKKASSDPWYKISEYFRDHPFIPNRILKLKEFALKIFS